MGDYGINHCAVIIGDWQYFGYDNGLPAQYPANPTLGGDAGMEAMSAAARSNGCYFALHENYADYYPDYPGYTPSATMLKPNGAQLVSWLNTVTGIQAFATKPGLFVTNAATQAPRIHQNYGTNASFLDVNSSAAPAWRADQDASTFGAGMFAIYRDASISLFAYERAIEQGPVFGEGKYHWFYSGLLDGVEAQFGSEYPRLANGLVAPLFVDFDLMRIHPLQVNYGMGYYDRWMPGGTTITSTLALDAYRMQEVIFGHNPYLTDALWSSVPRALLEQNLVSPLATRSALQTANNIAYQVDGAWVDASGAARAGNFSRVQVSYPNGDSVIANGLPSTFLWNGLQIPQYGWAAKGAGYVAYTALLGGQIADYSQTSQSLFANARNQADLLADGTLAAPSLVAMQQVGPRALALQLQWNVNTPGPSTPYREFIHFVPSNTPSGSNALAAQLSASPAVPTTSWTTGEIVTDPPVAYTLPANMADGDYQIRVGLFNGLERAALYGNNDGNLRYTVGSLTLSNKGANLALHTIPVAIAQPDARLNGTGAVVNFGTLSTDGMVWLRQQPGQTQAQLRISTYPRSRNVVVKINSATLPMPASLVCDNGDTIAPSALSGGTWQVNLRSRKYCSWNGTLPH